MRKKMLLAIACVLLLVSTAAADPGDTLWTRTYGGSGGDRGCSVQQTSDGGYIIAGGTGSFGAGGDVYLVKTDSCGDTLWTRTYGGSSLDQAFSVQQTPDGGYIIAGDTKSCGAGLFDVYLVKTDSCGDTLWTRTHGGSDEDAGLSVQQTSDGGYIVAGLTVSFGAGSVDFYLLKTDSCGDTLWTRTYGGSDWDEGYSVQQTSDGGYIIVGQTESFGAGARDVYLVKTDSSGDTLWTRTYGGSGYDEGFSVRQTSDGGYIIAGGTNSFGGDYSDLCLLKTASSGDTLWTRTYGGSNFDKAYSVQQTSDGGYIIAGSTSSFGAGSGDVYLVKVSGEPPQPILSIDLVPDQSRVIVPRGGSFGFTATVTNNTDDVQWVDIWLMAYVPGIGMYGPLRQYNHVKLYPHHFRGAHLNQNIPNIAPISDEYIYYGYVGDYPAVVIDSSYFPFEVITGAYTKAGEQGWVLTGSFLEGVTDLPSEFALMSNYPNPFNAQTVIQYQLPINSSVKLEVYNLLGEKVATLVDSKQQAGYRSVIWDAKEVSSGLYFYKLTAGDYSETKRMMLVK